MANPPTNAERFRVERTGPFEVYQLDGGWLVSSGGNGNQNGWLHREGFLVDFSADKITSGVLKSWNLVCDGLYFPTEAEAQFRLLLYTDPRQALAAFIEGTDWEYVGSCNACWGRGMEGWTDKPCQSCRGTGGQPDAEAMGIAADWYEERGCEMEASVLRGMITKGTDNGN